MGANGDKPVLVIGGPTASGKSGLALDLACALGGVVINADSMQIYRELRILTARPGSEAEKAAPHRLYGVLPAAEICSVHRWRELALAEIAAAHGESRLPIVVGGTGLYLKALIEGLSDVPEVPETVRAKARARLAEIGNARLHVELADRDPVAAVRVRPSDTQRLLRAYEVLEATGRPLAHWQRAGAPLTRPSFGFLPLLLMPPRPALRAACDARFLTMMAAGALDEVRALMALRLPPDRPALKAMGVPELARHVAGEISLDEAVVAAQTATRRYAKRQVTWFRHQFAQAFTVETQYSHSFLPEILKNIRQFLLTLSPPDSTVAAPPWRA